MAEATAIQPDTEFLKRVMASGGGDLKKCYQCATCAAVCGLSPDDSPFPRKQMIEAQWGLKDRLVSDPAIWLCHNCAECTERCPRGARPGDVMGALRREAIREFAFPRFMGAMVAAPKALPLLFLLPVLVFTAVLLWAPRPVAPPPFEFNNLFPIAVLEPIFFAVSGFALLALIAGLVRFIRALPPPSAPEGLPQALTEVATHRRFQTCDEENSIRTAHLLTMWGFIGLAIVGTIAGLGSMFGFLRTPMALTNGIKIFANLSALVAVIGSTMLELRRARTPGTYFDWLLVATLGGVILTGILSELLRLVQTNAMYGIYFIHLVLVFTLLLYAPYSKFAHLAYRTVAMARVAKPPAVQAKDRRS